MDQDKNITQQAIDEVLAERAAAQAAEEERKKQEEAAAHEKGWKLIFDYLNKVKDTTVTTILLRAAEDSIVYKWFDNAAVLVEKYDASRFETARDTFISTIKSVDDEKVRILVADTMRFVFKMAALKIEPWKYVKGVYAFRELSEQIGDALGESDLAKAATVNMWKDAVYVRHKGAPVKNILHVFKKTWFEKMIADIKAADPKYEAPKFRLGLIAGDCGDK